MPAARSRSPAGRPIQPKSRNQRRTASRTPTACELEELKQKGPQTMSVKFTIRGSDILRLKSALLWFKHPERDKRWIIFLEVMPSMASFRFGEACVDYPVDGKSQGYARFSEELFRDATGEFPNRN